MLPQTQVKPLKKQFPVNASMSVMYLPFESRSQHVPKLPPLFCEHRLETVLLSASRSSHRKVGHRTVEKKRKENSTGKSPRVDCNKNIFFQKNTIFCLGIFLRGLS